MRGSSVYSIMLVCLCALVINPGWASHDLTSAMDEAMDVMVIAPPDTTIDANRNGCWSVVTLDSAEVINPCGMPLDSFQVWTPFDTLHTNGGTTAFRIGGPYKVYYIAWDACNTTHRDSMFVTVVDTTPPVAICTGPKIVTISTMGMARIPAATFDGGSIEFCFKYYKVRRLMPPVAYTCATPENPDYMLDDEIKFCCEDQGDSVMVLLRVYDMDPGPGVVPDDTLMGHFDDCMTKVVVQDKLPPELICPPDTTIECGDHINIDSLALPMVIENCDSISFDITLRRNIDKCGVGEIQRVITGTDGNGNSSTCIQTIFIVNNDKFDGLDTNQLKWPEPFVMVFDCHKIPDTSLTGFPFILDDECSQVAVTWEDEVYQFDRDACSKVIRKWKVIDWCQYDPRVNSRCTPSNGCWTFDQVIKVLDTIPNDVTVPNDTIVPYRQAGCHAIFVSLPEGIADTCYKDEILIISHKVDLDSDGVIDREVGSADASGLYTPGMHLVIFETLDGCGNLSMDTTRVTVKDSTNPTPISMTGVNVVLIDMGGGMIMTSIGASKLNASSYDNCSAAEDLIYSFSPNTSDSVAVFTCDHVGLNNLQLWVTDECGNQAFVFVTILVEDNDDLCPTTITTSNISGQVGTYNGMMIPGVEVELTSANLKDMEPTDDEGLYLFSGVQNGGSYKLVPHKSGDPMEGISTKDLILIQRHLLGQKELESPEKLIAADVNESGHLSARDVADLRALILGNKQSLPQGRDWAFIPSTFQFADPKDPFANSWPETYQIGNLSQEMDVHFKAIKLGDVDHSYDPLNSHSLRSEDAISVGIRRNPEDNSLEIYSLQEMWINGLQMKLDFSEISSNSEVLSNTLEGWNSGNYSWILPDGSLTISWSQGEELWINEGSPILSLPFGGDAPLPLVDIDHEFSMIYLSNDNDRPIQLDGSFVSPNDAESLIVNVEPNPFFEFTTINVHSNIASEGSWSLSSVTGKRVLDAQLTLHSGWNTIEIGENVIHPGIYILTVSNGIESISSRIVKIE